MILTEEQRGALAHAINYIDETDLPVGELDGFDREVIRAMIDSSDPISDVTELVELLAAGEHEQWADWAQSILDSEPGLSDGRKAAWPEMIATPYENLSEELKNKDRREVYLRSQAALDYIQQQSTEIERLRAMIDSSEHTREPPKMVGFDLERARAEVDTASSRRFSESREQARIFCAEEILPDALDEIERLRAALDESEQILAHKTKTATHWYEEGLKTRADLVQSKRVVEQQAARLKELESSLDEAEALTKKNADLMNAYLARIAELEDALVEGLTNFLHYRASCYDPARRCPYAKECDDCSTWDACGHVEKFRSEARQRLQAEGKIGPDAEAAHRECQEC